MSEIFQKNIKAIIKKDMTLGVQIFAMEEKGNVKYDVFMDPNDSANINIIDVTDKENPRPMYETKPVDETLAKIDEMEEYTKYPYLYFYGIGNGIFYNLLLKNERHKRILIVEPELELLFIALHFNDFSEDISTGRLTIKLANQIDFNSASRLLGGNTKIYFKAYKLDILTDYYTVKFVESIKKVNQDIAAAFRHKIIGLGNDSIDSLIGLEHHIMNIENIVKTPKLMNLVDNMKTSNMCVVVSTGPSLSKQLPLLHKIQDHVTIISVDASAPILEEHDIIPDVVTSIERITLTSKFFQRLSDEFKEKVIFALTSIQDKIMFRAVSPGQVQMSMRPFGYNKYFKLSDWGYIGHGMSSANMAFEFAYNGLFEQVVLIGQDLAYGEDGTSHAKKHTFGEKERKILDSDNPNARFVEAYGGKGQIQTRLIWELFKNFFEMDIAEAKRVDETEGRKRHYINSTEGGARIHGTEEIPFARVVDDYVDFSKKKEKIKLVAPTEKQIKANIKKVRKKMEFMLKYYTKVEKKSEKVFLQVNDICKTLDELDLKDNFDMSKLDKKMIKRMDNVRIKINKVKDFFEDKSFSMVLSETLSALMIHQETEIALLQIRNIKNEEDRVKQLVDWMYVHKYWLFSFTGAVRATFDTVLFGIDENNSEDFLKTMVSKYTDYSFDEFMFLKTKFFIGKRLWLNFDKDTEYKKRINLFMNSLAEKLGYKEFNKQLNKELLSKEDIVMVNTPEMKLDYRPKLVKALAKIENNYIKENKSKKKKVVAIYLLDEYPWLEENIEEIKEEFKKANCDLIIGKELPKDDNEELENLYFFGLNSTKYLSSIDYLITVKHRYLYDFASKDTNLDDSKIDITIDGADFRDAKTKVDIDLIAKATAHGFNNKIEMLINEKITPIFIDKTSYKSKIKDLIKSL
jgi:hypothetical protein